MHASAFLLGSDRHMKLGKPRKPQRQQKIAFGGITKSQKSELFAEFAVATLLMGLFLLPGTTASQITAIATLNNSGTIISAISGLTVKENQILTLSGKPLILKGMGYTYFVNAANPTSGTWTMPDGSMVNSWSITGINETLNFMEASNSNVVRVFMTVEYWLRNTNNFQSHIEYFITQAAAHGIYTDLTFWNTNATNTEPNGILPWNDGNHILNSSADFVNLWGNISTTLKNYPTAIFELWNEPQSNDPSDETLWFNVTQQCINRIRSVGATQLIVIQWNYQLNYDFYSKWMSGMEWVFTHPLSDPCGNLIYSTHIYEYTWTGFYDSSSGQEVTDYANINTALTACSVYAVAAVHPVFIGEIGCSNWDLGNQTIYYNNTLTLLDQHGIGYCAFAAPPWSSAMHWGLVELGVANYTLNSAGVILVNHLGEIGRAHV
jgi:hypothetical protein